MFRRFKDRLTEVSEEVKRDPRFQNSLASVNSFAEKSVALIKNEQPQLQPPLLPSSRRASSASDQGNGVARIQSQLSLSSLIQSSSPPPENADGLSSLSLELLTAPGPQGSPKGQADRLSPNSDMAGAFNPDNSFFSLTEEDDETLALDGAGLLVTAGSADLRRKSETGSLNRDHSSTPTMLFPVYESPPLQRRSFALPSTSSDMDSTAGSEMGSEMGSATQLTAISKEQLFNMLQKSRTR